MSELDEIISRSTILIPSGPAGDPTRKHLHILLNDPVHVDVPLLYCNTVADPTMMVQIVSISTCPDGDRYYDNTCILQPGEHGFITCPSFVSYTHTCVLSAKSIQLGLDEKRFVPRDPMQEEVFSRVHAGLNESDDTPGRMRKFWCKYC